MLLVQRRRSAGGDELRHLRKSLWSKTPSRDTLLLGLHWRRCSLRGPADSVHKWLPDVLVCSQAHQATPEIVGHSTSGSSWPAQQLSSFVALGKISATPLEQNVTQLPLLSIASVNTSLMEFSSRVEKTQENSRSSRQPSSLNSTPLAMDCLHEAVNEVEHSSTRKPNGDHRHHLGNPFFGLKTTSNCPRRNRSITQLDVTWLVSRKSPRIRTLLHQEAQRQFCFPFRGGPWCSVGRLAVML